MDEQKRLRRIAAFAVLLVLLFIGAIVTYATITWGRLDKMEQVIASLAQPVRGLDGSDGADGRTPIKNVDYFDGIDGHNAVSTNVVEKQTIIKDNPLPGLAPSDEQVAVAVEEYCINHNCKGEDGAKGDRGITILLRVNPLTLLEECRVLTDVSWQPIEECGL